MPPARGEIWFVDLDPAVGREQGGVRPVLVVSADFVNRRPLVVAVVPGTKGSNLPRDLDTNVRLEPVETGLALETVFLCFQIRAIDQQRFRGSPAGRVSDGALQRIEDTLRLCLDL